MKRCDGGHVPARRTPEEEGGNHRSQALVCLLTLATFIINALWLPNMLCPDKGQTMKMRSLQRNVSVYQCTAGTPAQQVYPQDWGCG